MAWTEEATDRMKQLWADGWSAGQIARDLGTTRNAVIGKVHRLGLPGRVHKTRLKTRVLRPRQLRIRPRSFKLDVGAFEKAIAEPEVGKVKFMDLLAHHCRWPVGDPPDVLFCGDDRLEPHSYCARHCAVAFRLPGRTHTEPYWNDSRRQPNRGRRAA